MDFKSLQYNIRRSKNTEAMIAQSINELTDEEKYEIAFLQEAFVSGLHSLKHIPVGCLQFLSLKSITHHTGAILVKKPKVSNLLKRSR